MTRKKQAQQVLR